MIRISVFNHHPTHKVNNSVFKQLARNVLGGEGTRTANCNVIFVDDEYMVGLNETYLRHAYTTDVLSFPLHEDAHNGIEGEVYINIDQARRQARKFHATYKNELARLAIHGVLHLLGYRDDTPRLRLRMSREEDRYLLLLH